MIDKIISWFGYKPFIKKGIDFSGTMEYPEGLGEVYSKLHDGEATGINLTAQEVETLLDYIDNLYFKLRMETK